MFHRRDRKSPRERDEEPARWSEPELSDFDDARHFASREFTREASPTGQSSFAQRGQSSEERMPEDDSAERFPGEPEGAAKQESAPRGEGHYGSGGSYGYGGAFEHDGLRGPDGAYQAGGDPGRGNEEFYEATGGFGYDVSAYGREGLGYPGHAERREGAPATPPSHRDPERPTSGRDAAHEDARQGFSQGSGYAQSGGQRQGSGYGSGAEHADGKGHEGAGTRSRGGAKKRAARH